MIQPQLWNRRYSWPEWRQIHSNLSERDAQMLFEHELRMYDLYERDLTNLKEQRVDSYIQNLGEYETTIQHTINYGGRVGPTVLGQYSSNVKTYNNTITNESVTIPDPPFGYKKYTKVTLEAVGGGGMGQIGYVSNTPGGTSKFDLWAIGNGGGGGAYVKRTVTFDSDSPPVISITVGAGGQIKGQDGGASSFTIDGTTATANGGEGFHMTEGGLSEQGQDITPNSSISAPENIHPLIGSRGGQPAGTYDTGIAGTNGVQGGGLIVNPGGSPYSGVLMTGQPGSLAQKGIGGKSGYPGAESAAAASVNVDANQDASNFVHAENGKAPGGGGGGGFVDEVTAQGLGDMGAGHGANGRVIVTFGYS